MSYGAGLAPRCIRGSARTFAMPASRASREDHLIQAKTTVSPGWHVTASEMR